MNILGIKLDSIILVIISLLLLSVGFMFGSFVNRNNKVWLIGFVLLLVGCGCIIIGLVCFIIDISINR